MNIQSRTYQISVVLLFVAGALMPATGQQDNRDTINSIKPGARKATKKQPVAKGPRTGKRSSTTGKKVASRRIQAVGSHSPPLHNPPITATPKPAALPILVRSQGLDWQVQKGSNQAEATADELHIDQSGAQDTTAYSTAYSTIKLNDSPLWKVACSAQFGQLRSMASGFRLTSRGVSLGVVMADGVSGGLSAYVDRSSERFARKYDGEWHRFEFIGTRDSTSLWMDGATIGHGPATSVPDALSIGALGASPGRQTEVRIRGIAVEPNPPTSNVVDLFNEVDLTGWIHGGVPWRCKNGLLANSGQDWVAFDPLIPTNGFELEMRVRIIDGIRLRIHLGQDFYVGNDGNSHRLAIVGDVADEKQLSDDTYVTGQWNDLRIQVDSQDNVVLSQNNRITHVARRRVRKPFRLVISPGDAFSHGHIEVAAVKLLCLQ